MDENLSQGSAPADGQMQLQARTRELAVLAGRDSTEVSQRDYEQAKRELLEPIAEVERGAASRLDL